MIEIHYWPLRGLVQHLLTLCEYLGVDYKYVHMTTSREEWLEHKKTAHGDDWHFANLPYLIDEDKYSKTPLCETEALQMYIMKRAGDAAKPLQKAFFEHPVEFTELCGVIRDLKSLATMPAYMSPSLDAFKATYGDRMKGFSHKLAGINKRFDDGRQFLFGELSVLDFFFCELLEMCQILEKELGLEGVTQHSNFTAYVARFHSVEKVAAYRAREDYMKRPFNNTMAVWK